MIDNTLAKDMLGIEPQGRRRPDSAPGPALLQVAQTMIRASWLWINSTLRQVRRAVRVWSGRQAYNSPISERIRVLAVTQVLLVGLLILVNLFMIDLRQVALVAMLAVPALLTTAALYGLRGSRFAEGAVYVNLTAIAALLAVSDPLSGTLSGTTWVLFQIWPPLAALALRRPRAAAVSVVIPLLLLLLSALLQISGLVPVTLLLPPAALLRDLTYQVVVLIVLSAGLHWMDRREQRVWRVALLATEHLHHELAVARTQVVEKAAFNVTLYDSLTGLPNRTLFLDRLGQAIQRSRRREARPFAVLLLDLDRFKTVNDSLGPLIGDELLIAVARRLEGGLRPGDTVARLGGDEFAVLVELLPRPEAAVEVATRLQDALGTPFPLHGQEIFSSTSIGIALGPAGYQRPEDMLRDVGAALYRAKRRGKAAIAVFEAAMYVQALTRLQLEMDLRRAIRQDEFVLYYQPIIALRTNEIVGFEALLRWQHPTRGIVAPGDFIAVAEDAGLLDPLSQWGLREACRQLVAWQSSAGPPLTVSVNIAASQLTHPDLVAQIGQTLRETGLAPGQLILEIVEGALVADGATAVLAQLKALGVQLSIDDFGTGYSSLSYLHRFPVDTIKIDRSFVSRLDSDPDHAEVLTAIVSLARSLGLDTIAEGVETREQCARLRTLGCNYGQGWLFAPALAPAEATVLLATSPIR
jgi:diguanylate cyclase (GGDEF)-like protein